jgi:capsular exopolysaccharide synthesis family protein
VTLTATVPDFSPEVDETRTLMLADIIWMSKRYFWVLAAVSLGFAIVAYVWAKHQPKQFDATAMLQVDQHGALSLSSIAISDDYELKIMTEMMALESRDVAFSVIKQMNLQNNLLFNPLAPKYTNLDDPATRNYLAGLFKGSLETKRVPKTELISVTFRSLSPVLSAAVANSVVDVSIEQNFRHRYRGSLQISGWLTKELDDLKGRVQTEQSELLNLEAKIGVLGTSETSETSIYEAELQDLLSESIRAQTEKFSAEAEYQELMKNPTGSIPPGSVPGAEILSQLNVQLSQLESQKAALAERYGPGYGPLAQIENQIANIKESLASSQKKMLEGALLQSQAAEKTQASVDTSIDQLKAQVKGMNPDAVRYKILKEQYLTDQTLYNGLLAMVSSGSIEAGLKTQEVNPMSAADIPSMHSRPRVLLDTVSGFGAGFLLASMIILIRFVLSDTVETVEQIEESLALPVLAAVPMYKLDAPNPSSQVMPLIALDSPRSAGAEAYKILRTSISLIPAGNGARVVAITSCGPSEGKSTTLMNLGAVFSQQNKRVLLIDADMRKPNVAKWLKGLTPNAPGLSRYLSDPSIKLEECLHTFQELPGMSIMPVGAIPPFPSELLGQGRFEQLVAWGRLNYDIVLVDTPPALLVTDALIVAQSVDILLLVARVGVAQRRSLRRLRKELARFPDKHFGTVANVVPQSQSYYYGYGGKYGYYGYGKDAT